MSTHAPGPWRIGAQHYQIDIYANRAGHAIASVFNPQHEGELKANARLIAAAPDLLKALQKIIAADDAQNLVQELIETAHAAIAKATGEEV